MDTGISWLDVKDLKNGLCPRSRGLDTAHVAALAEIRGGWPPILVLRHDHSVIDGHHRVAAAQMLGLPKVAASFFDGDPDEAFCEAVRRNTEHGLPLVIEDRKRAARTLLSRHADWSDRHISEICGLAPGTVARVRASSGTASSTARRVGRDGRVRLVQPESNHRRILQAVREHPETSLRAIAKEVGTSPETVRRVRQRYQEQLRNERLGQQTGTVPDNITSIARQGSMEASSDRAGLLAEGDPAVISTPEGRMFAGWFDENQTCGEWRSHVPAVPFSRIYEVADEARRRAHAWLDFAEALESRARVRTAARSM